MRQVRERKESDVKPQERHMIHDDAFCESIRRLLDRGVVAHTSANALKTQIVKLIRDYSFEIPYVQNQISDLFLDLCDLMVCGELSRMRGDTFKLYLTLMVYSKDVGRETTSDVRLLQEVAGIHDDMAMNTALSDLRDQGYIESLINPEIVGKRNSAKKRGSSAETSLFVQ